MRFLKINNFSSKKLNNSCLVFYFRIIKDFLKILRFPLEVEMKIGNIIGKMPTKPKGSKSILEMLSSRFFEDQKVAILGSLKTKVKSLLEITPPRFFANQEIANQIPEMLLSRFHEN